MNTQEEASIKAMVFQKTGHPLTLQKIPKPHPKGGEVRLKVLATGICRTDLHIIDGELSNPKLPLIMGHQIVGAIDSPSQRFQQGAIVGLPWLGKSCGICPYCAQKDENLCDSPQFTGYTYDGGYAEYCLADEDFLFPMPEDYPPEEAAPLLCAGMIGYRTMQMAKEAKKIAFYGFGAAARLLIQAALYQGKEVFVFTQPQDFETQKIAREMGASFAGSSKEPPPILLDAALIFASVGDLVPLALKAVRKGGKVICGGIHMSPIPSFPYSLLWEERSIQSVANLTRKDGEEWLTIASKIPIRTEVITFPLEKANEALAALRSGADKKIPVLIP